MGDLVLSVVVPVYNEEAVLGQTVARLTAVLEKLGEPYELIFVDDGSADRTPDLLAGYAEADGRIRVLNFSRNFGHQAAITAGVDQAQGEAVVVIDADLQDPPELIPAMVAKWREGYDVVYGQRLRREGETFFKKVSAAAFYRLLHWMTSVDIPLDTGDFRRISRRVADTLRGLKESHPFVRGLVAWVGFRQVALPFERQERQAGETKYTLKRMANLALAGLLSFSSLPLRLASYLGMLVAGIGFLAAGYVLYLKVFTRVTYPGWTSLMVVLLVIGGLQLLVLGIIGEYIRIIHDEARGRPRYILKEDSSGQRRD